MIQSALLFVLGFLCAGFIAVAVAPAIWRRAVALTRKRVEASMPLTLGEIQASKDALRAEYAMTVRRLEISVKDLKEKSARQLAEFNSTHVEMKQLTRERDELAAELAELRARDEGLVSQLSGAGEEAEGLRKQVSDARTQVDERTGELEKLEQLYDEASLASSSHQIELAARDAEIDKLTTNLAAMRNQRKDADRQVQELTADNKAALDAVKSERKRAAELERKLDGMISQIADLEERLERRENELSRLRESAGGDDGELDAQKDDDAAGRRKGKASTKEEKERERLRDRLTKLTRENKRLRERVVRKGGGAAKDAGRSAPDDALLREQIHQLAAEVVKMTAALEGPDSPVLKALQAPGGGEEQSAAARPQSLADRVRALQAASEPKK
ncbi:hypothetical protein [Aquamicrobium sp. LC103]|uniref:hypothetical protein n=1 Tax=Aquamicrobium sp. LC103 TaxID=1120658 RepID=UPI00063E9946|nr:hypothetical protein [Aquamicrobium sp. LC103]TKT77394.1 hypothetical protein XW59_013030 [Aquamicrobium sp. LC103]